MKHFITLVLASLVLVCCNPRKENLSESIPCNDSITNITKLIKHDTLLQTKIRTLNAKVCLANNLKTVKEIEEILSLRDELMQALNQDSVVLGYYENPEVKIKPIEKELNRLGIQSLWAESMYFGMDRTFIVQETIDKVADEPLALKAKILALNGDTKSGEYPYTYLDTQMELVTLAEKMISNYPDHPYTLEILEPFLQSLTPLVDVHSIQDADGEINAYIVSGTGIDSYPGLTSIENHSSFIQTHTISRFAKVVDNIIKNISTINNSTEAQTIYMVTVPQPTKDKDIFTSADLNAKIKQLPDYLFDTSLPLAYLWLEIPVPHLITQVANDGTYTSLFVYRFFESKEKAEESLKEIQAIIPGANIFEYKKAEISITDKQ